jgi:hypothetical protein
MKMRAFWDTAKCSLAGVDRRFRREYCVHHQGDEKAGRERIAGYIGFGYRLLYNQVKPKVGLLVEYVTLLLRIREVPDSNLGPQRLAILTEIFRRFLSLSRKMLE